MFYKRRQNGFTLIELLVVIAIIGILSGVVLTSLNAARDKAANAAVKSNLANMRAQAEILYDTDGNYNKVCGANSAAQDATVAAAIAAAVKANGGTAGVCGKPASGNAGEWAISAPLKETEGSNTHWCVDSKGNSMGRASNIDADGTSCS